MKSKLIEFTYLGDRVSAGGRCESQNKMLMDLV